MGESLEYLVGVIRKSGFATGGSDVLLGELLSVCRVEAQRFERVLDSRVQFAQSTTALSVHPISSAFSLAIAVELVRRICEGISEFNLLGQLNKMARRAQGCNTLANTLAV